MKRWERNWSWLLLPLVVVVLLGFVSLVGDMDERAGIEGKQRLEETLHKTAVACYAAEGSYPPSVAYMEEHYGVQYDKDRYLVAYDAFASNLMPDITVLERDHEAE